MARKRGLLLGRWDRLEGMYRERIEELVRDKERRRGRCLWNEAEILAPYDGDVGVLRDASMADGSLDHGGVSAEKLALRVTQAGTSFHEVDGFDCGHKRREA